MKTATFEIIFGDGDYPVLSTERPLELEGHEHELLDRISDAITHIMEFGGEGSPSIIDTLSRAMQFEANKNLS